MDKAFKYDFTRALESFETIINRKKKKFGVDFFEMVVYNYVHKG